MLAGGECGVLGSAGSLKLGLLGLLKLLEVVGNYIGENVCFRYLYEVFQVGLGYQISGRAFGWNCNFVRKRKKRPLGSHQAGAPNLYRFYI